MPAQVINMPVAPKEPLQRVASISILGETYDLAKNGSHFHLVEHKEPDAYQRPVARKVDLSTWRDEDKIQALVDHAGESYTRIAALEDELARAHSALQREAEPEAKSRRPVGVREGCVVGVPNLLEPKAEGDGV